MHEVSHPHCIPKLLWLKGQAPSSSVTEPSIRTASCGPSILSGFPRSPLKIFLSFLIHQEHCQVLTGARCLTACSQLHSQELHLLGGCVVGSYTPFLGDRILSGCTFPSRDALYTHRPR